MQASARRRFDGATSHLDASRSIIWAAAALLALAAAIVAAVSARRSHRRDRDARRRAERQRFEGELQQGLEMSRSEADVYNLLERALPVAAPGRRIEMLIADSSHAHFHRTLSTAHDGDVDGCPVVSPNDCPAATRGHTLHFRSSRELGVCPYLRDRPSGECSAVCVPVSIAGKTVGVTHAVGADGVAQSDDEVSSLELASRRASERIAMLRAFATSETEAHSDPLTGLLNRRSLEHRVSEMAREGEVFMVAYGDLDHFKLLNDTHGHEAGDRALRLFSHVLRDSVRPSDLVCRYGGEEFVVVLPDCTQDGAVAVLERVRERLALALTNGTVPPFTVSFGLASSTDHTTLDETVAAADRALLEAKQAGRNRVIVASSPVHTPSP